MIWSYSGRTKIVAAWSLLAIAVLISLAGCTPLGAYWLVAPKERVDVIVPEGYEGPVLIAYQVPDGVIPQKKEDVWQYHLQHDGALLLQTDPLSGIGKYAFYYELADGALEPLPMSTCFDDVEYEGVVVCSSGTYEIHNARELRPSESYFVGRIEDWRQFKRSFEEFDRLYNRYFDQLALPAK